MPDLKPFKPQGPRFDKTCQKCHESFRTDDENVLECAVCRPDKPIGGQRKRKAEYMRDWNRRQKEPRGGQ